MGLGLPAAGWGVGWRAAAHAEDALIYGFTCKGSTACEELAVAAYVQQAEQSDEQSLSSRKLADHVPLSTGNTLL